MSAYKGLVVGGSPRRATVFTLVVIAVLLGGWALGDALLSLGSSAVAVSLALLVVLATCTAIQAKVNGSVLLSLLLSLALPVGVWSGTFFTPSRPLRPTALNVLSVAVTFALAFGMTGHLAGMELARWRGTGGRIASEKEQALVGVFAIGAGVALHLIF